MLLKEEIDKKPALFFATGTLLVLLGLLANEWSVARLWSHDGVISSASVRIAIAFMELTLLSLGGMMIACRTFLGWKEILLYFISWSICLGLFLTYDFYQAYKILKNQPYPQFMEGVHQKDDRLGWIPKPGSVGRHRIEGLFDVRYEMDERGYKKVSNQPGPADFSIYFFGDSFAFGNGVSNQDSFPNILAQKHLTPNVHVFNLGVMGYGIVQMVERFLQIESELRPGDVVVFCPITYDNERNLKVGDFVGTLLFENRIAFDFFPDFSHGEIQPKRINKWFYQFRVLTQTAPYTGRLFAAIWKGITKNYDGENLAMIQLVKKKCEKRGAHFLFFYLPFPSECLEGKFRKVVPSADPEILKHFPNSEGEIARLTYFDDGHWNPEGNQIVAKAVASILIKNNMVPERYWHAEN